MPTDLRGLYDKYADYVRQLEDDFVRHVGDSVSAAYRPRLLEFDDFRRFWAEWGNFDGVQERWRCRFESGYEVAAEALSERLRVALAPTSQQSRDPSAGRAA